MKVLAASVLAVALIGVGWIAGSPPRSLFAQSAPTVVGPVVGEAGTFRDKSRPNGNGIYQNLTAYTMAVTVIFEAGTDEASLYLKDESGKAALQAQVRSGTMDRHRSLTISVAPRSTLWLKSEGGIARWQIVGAVPAQ